MENYPSNSHKKSNPGVEEPAAKKIEKVIEGKVVRRKKPLSKRFAETFIGGDPRSVGLYVVYDILLPAVKDTLADAMSQGFERMLFGEARSTSRRTGRRPSSDSYMNYHRVPNRAVQGGRMEASPKRSMSRQARARHNFDEIILQTRVEAEEVISQFLYTVEKYGSVTVADLYELVGEPSEFTDDKYGWQKQELLAPGATGIVRVTHGYLLDIPKPEPLD